MSRVPSIVVASKIRAEELLSSVQYVGVISIGGPREDPPVGLDRAEKALRLEFDDVMAPKPGKVSPTRADVEEALAFGAEIAGEAGEVLVHCAAGLSRSPAVAVALYASWLGAGREREAVERVFAQMTLPWANPLLIDLADSALGRDGGLTRAFEEATQGFGAAGG